MEGSVVSRIGEQAEPQIVGREGHVVWVLAPVYVSIVGLALCGSTSRGWGRRSLINAGCQRRRPLAIGFGNEVVGPVVVRSQRHVWDEFWGWRRHLQRARGAWRSDLGAFGRLVLLFAPLGFLSFLGFFVLFALASFFRGLGGAGLVVAYFSFIRG